MTKNTGEMIKSGLIDPVLFVKQQYSDPEVVKSYSKVGLFPSEEKLIDRFFEAGSTILDIGCGAGRTTIHLAKKGYKVIGIDLVPAMIEAARRQARDQNVNVIFEVMDAVRMSFPSESFDNVLFSYNGFDQIPGKKNREKILRDVFNILRRGGRFLLATRTGLAWHRILMLWAWVTGVYLYHRLIYRETKLEFGDKVWKGRYYHYINPLHLNSVLRGIGYEPLYFNSERRLLQGKKARWLTAFSNDRMFFHVLMKK